MRATLALGAEGFGDDEDQRPPVEQSNVILDLCCDALLVLSADS